MNFSRFRANVASREISPLHGSLFRRVTHRVFIDGPWVARNIASLKRDREECRKMNEGADL